MGTPCFLCTLYFSQSTIQVPVTTNALAHDNECTLREIQMSF